MNCRNSMKTLMIQLGPWEYHSNLRNECSTQGAFPNYSMVFVREYSLLMNAENTSATIGWYNQSVASVASKAQVATIHNNNLVKRKHSGDQPDRKKFTKLINPPVVGVSDKKEKQMNYALECDYHNTALRGACFRCWNTC
jgi:hypothetical protein